jgi:hypothetical protein
MRASDLFEVLIAVMAATTVIGAIGSILWRVTRGNPEERRLDALKLELQSEAARDARANSSTKTSDTTG